MKTNNLGLSNLLIIMCLFIALWIVAFKIEPFLLYHSQQIGFNFNFGFLKDYLLYPGGISNYLADFMAQFFSFNLFGSFLIVAVASLQGFVALRIVSEMIGKPKLKFSVFTVILLLAISVLFDYQYPYYVTIRILFVFLFTFSFFAINKKWVKRSLYFFPVLAILLFYLASGAALIVFTISAAIIFINPLTKKQGLTMAPLILLFAAIIPFVSYKYIFPEILSGLYRFTQTNHPEMPAYQVNFQLYAYYFILPVILISSLFAKKTKENRKNEQPERNQISIKIGDYLKTTYLVFIQIAVCFVLGYLLFVKSYDPLKKKLAYIEYYAENEEWVNVLKTAESIQSYDFKVNYQINRAYAHLGQLPDKLFRHPQMFGSRGLIFDPQMINGSLTMPASDLYFDLGFMSESAHWAFEGQTLMPNSPRILKRLVMINLVNRKYELAQKFINVLDQNILYRKWVDKYEKYVTDTMLANNDPVIAEKRQFNPNRNAINQFPSDNLALLFETNKDNRLAYDYLVSLCILDSNFPGFIKYIQEYKYYNIKTLPEPWAEALSVYILKIKSMPSFVSEETISKECLQSFTAFNNLMKHYNNDKEAAKNYVRKDFEDTYWYYALYLNPKVTNIFNEKR